MAGNMAILKKCCCIVPCQSSGNFNFNTNAFSPVCSPRIALCIDGQTGDCAVVNAGTDAIVLNRTVAGNPATYEYIEAGVKKYEVIMTIGFAGITTFVMRTYRWNGSTWVLCTEDGVSPTRTINHQTGYGFEPFTSRRIWALDSWIPPYLRVAAAGINICTGCMNNPGGGLDDDLMGSWQFSNLNVNGTADLLLQAIGAGAPCGTSSASNSIWMKTQGSIDITYWKNSSSRSCSGTPDGVATIPLVWCLNLFSNIAQLQILAPTTGLPDTGASYFSIFSTNVFDAWNIAGDDDYFSIPCAGEEKEALTNDNTCGTPFWVAAEDGDATLTIPAHGS